LVLVQVTFRPDLWLHFADPTTNVQQHYDENFDRMRQFDLIFPLPKVRGMVVVMMVMVMIWWG
jgi:hypothetical protein